MERRLTTYILDYQNACVELRSLLGYYPSGRITVDDSFLDKVPSVDLPDLELLEQIALIRRPELRETDIQRHISVVECRKAILSMFPNARIFFDFNNVNNSFLYKQSWWAMAYSQQADAETMRSFGQAIAIMAQVRISHADILANKDIYDRAAKTFKNYDTALKAAQKNRKIAASELSRLEVDHMRLTTAEASIEQTLSLANYYVSFYRLMNAIGMRDTAQDAMKKLPAELKAAQTEAGVVLSQGKGK